MERGQQKLLFGELKRNKRERFQEAVGEFMCSSANVIFWHTDIRTSFICRTSKLI